MLEPCEILFPVPLSAENFFLVLLGYSYSLLSFIVGGIGNIRDVHFCFFMILARRIKE